MLNLSESEQEILESALYHHVSMLTTFHEKGMMDLEDFELSKNDIRAICAKAGIVDQVYRFGEDVAELEDDRRIARAENAQHNL